MKSIAVLLLLGVINARDITLLDTQLSVDSESESGQLGSLEQAFLEQKLKKYQRGIEMIGLDQKEWDSDTLKLIDANEYSKDVKASLDDVELNIEIENKPHPASKQVMAQIQDATKTVAKAVVKKQPAPKATEETDDTATFNEKLGSEYTDNNHKGETITRTNLDVLEMQKILQEQEDQLQKTQMNLAKIESAKEKNIKKLAQTKKKNEQKTMADVATMDKEWEQFCRTFQMKHFHKAMKEWVEIDAEGALPVDLLKVNTKQILEREGFDFAEVSQNAYAADQLSLLGAAQTNLNQDINNETLIHKFTGVAKTVVQNLKKKYLDGFHDPATKHSQSMAQTQDQDEE